MKAAVDWSAFEGEPVSQTCYCRCGGTFRSHAKAVRNPDGRWQSRSKDPCPSCSRDDDLFRVTGDPERMTIGGGS